MQTILITGKAIAASLKGANKYAQKRHENVSALLKIQRKIVVVIVMTTAS